MVQIEKSDDERLNLSGKIVGDWVVVENRTNGFVDYWWNNYLDKTDYLISLKDGTRTVLEKETSYISACWFSPEGRYLIYFDGKCYNSYNLKSGRSLNLTEAMHVPLNLPSINLPENKIVPFGLAGWLPSDDAFFVYDKYDIWQIDPSGKRAPTNITNFYGRKQHITFRMLSESDISIVLEPQKLLLVAFDSASKCNGFYKFSLCREKNPSILTMSSNAYYAPFFSFCF